MRPICYILTLTLLVTLPCQGQSTFDTAKREADSLYNNMKFREAYDIYVSLLGSNEVKKDKEKKLEVLNDLCDVSDLTGHEIDQMQYLQQMLELSQAEGNSYYHSLGLMMMGKHLFYEGDREQGISYVEQAIDMMEKTDRPNTDHLAHSQMNVLITLCREKDDLSKAVEVSERNVRLTRQGTRWGSYPQVQQQDRLHHRPARSYRLEGLARHAQR